MAAMQMPQIFFMSDAQKRLVASGLQGLPDAMINLGQRLSLDQNLLVDVGRKYPYPTDRVSDFKTDMYDIGTPEYQSRDLYSSTYVDSKNLNEIIDTFKSHIMEGASGWDRFVAGLKNTFEMAADPLGVLGDFYETDGVPKYFFSMLEQGPLKWSARDRVPFSSYFPTFISAIRVFYVIVPAFRTIMQRDPSADEIDAIAGAGKVGIRANMELVSQMRDRLNAQAAAGIERENRLRDARLAVQTAADAVNQVYLQIQGTAIAANAEAKKLPDGAVSTTGLKGLGLLSDYSLISQPTATIDPAINQTYTSQPSQELYLGVMAPSPSTSLSPLPINESPLILETIRNAMKAFNLSSLSIYRVSEAKINSLLYSESGGFASIASSGVAAAASIAANRTKSLSDEAAFMAQKAQTQGFVEISYYLTVLPKIKAAADQNLAVAGVALVELQNRVRAQEAAATAAAAQRETQRQAELEARRTAETQTRINQYRAEYAQMNEAQLRAEYGRVTSAAGIMSAAEAGERLVELTAEAVKRGIDLLKAAGGSGMLYAGVAAAVLAVLLLRR